MPIPSKSLDPINEVCVKLRGYIEDKNALFQLEEHLSRIGVDIQLGLHASIDELARGLRKYNCTESILILIVRHRHTLNHLLAMGDLLFDQRIILVLPDRFPATIAAGHRFYPRYMSDLDGGLTDVFAVLDKMIIRENPAAVINPL